MLAGNIPPRQQKAVRALEYQTSICHAFALFLGKFGLFALYFRNARHDPVNRFILPPS